MDPKTRPILLCVPIHFDDGYYPSAGSRIEQRLIYWRSIAVLCASVRRAKIPRLEILICANERAPPAIEAILEQLGVGFASPSFSFHPPKGLYPAFSGAFYLFDSMDYCRRNFAKQTSFVFMDPDCVALNNLDPLREHGNAWSLIGYELDLENNEEVNGCSKIDLFEFFGTIPDSRALETPRYFGGEFLMVAGEQLPDLCHSVDRVWRLNMRAFHTGGKTLKTEEHVLSVALALSGNKVGLANDFVKRMWTRPSYRNVSLNDVKFSIWHLPAEKRFALQALFRLMEEDLGKLLNLDDRIFCDLLSQLIRLNLSLVEKPLYLIYPKVKKLIRRFNFVDHTLPA